MGRASGGGTGAGAPEMSLQGGQCQGAEPRRPGQKNTGGEADGLSPRSTHDSSRRAHTSMITGRIMGLRLVFL